MTFDEYLAIPGVHWTNLKEMRKSPLHYDFRVHNPAEDSTIFARGRSAHTAVLEPDRFLLDYAIFTGKVRRGAEWDKCCAANKGKTILKPDEYGIALSIRDAIREHPVAGPLLADQGRSEFAITWKDEATGLAMKGRLDRLTDSGKLVELKTTFDVEARRFGHTAARMGYHIQAALYRRGIRAALGVDPVVKIVAVTATEPHEVAVYGLDEDTLWAGEEEADDLLAKVAAGNFSGRWEGRYQEEQTLALPAWAFNEEQEVDGLGLTFGAEEAS